MSSYYDVAQVCLNGHLINDCAKRYSEHNVEFCPKCGEKTTIVCPLCNAHIRGDYHVDGVIGASSFEMPSYCHNCGKAYPWTENKVQTAIEMFLELGDLDDIEKKTIEQDINNIARDIPQSELSALRIKKIWKRCGTIAYNVIMEFATKTSAEILKNP